MRLIGITGGVGAGKTEVLAYIKSSCNCRIELADEVAHRVKEKGMPAYERLVELLSEEVLDIEGEIDKGKMAQMIFSDMSLLKKVNEIIHPAVKEYITQEIDKEQKLNRFDFFFFEAALLIEEEYLDILDEIWYIFTREEIRRERLKASRGYSDEKISQIMKAQLPEDEFRKHCAFVIDNNQSLEDTHRQIHEKLRELLWQGRD